MILNRKSIVPPSILHRNDGLTMEYRWSIDGVTSEKERRIRHESASLHTNCLGHRKTFQGFPFVIS